MRASTQMAAATVKADEAAMIDNSTSAPVPSVSMAPDTAASAALGELCGRAARVELFEGHARSGDVRNHKYAGAPLSWAPASL